MKKRKIERILLIFPSLVYKRAQSRKTCIYPLGLGHLAAFVEDRYQVRVLDSSLEGFENEVEQENGLNCYGLDDESYRRIISEYQPQAVGVSGLFSSLHRQMLRATRLAKEVDPGILTVCGGPHASALPDLLLEDGSVDFCVVGEGEETFRGLLERLESGGDVSNLAGVAWKGGGKVMINPRAKRIDNLDELPFPAWHLTDLERYFNIGSVQGLRMEGASKKSLRLVQVTTSRGCPFSCTYCGKHAVWGSKIRYMSAGRVMEMLEALVDRYGVERVAFQDDNLTADRKRALDLFRLMSSRGLPLTWEAHNGLAFSTLDEELLDAMAESGCVSFTGAVESGSEEVLKKVKKRVDLERSIELARHARDLGIDVRAFYMIGFPGETREQVEATRAHMRRLEASVSAMAIYTPLPGSPLFRDLEEKGVIDSRTLDFEKLSFGAFDQALSELSMEELHRIRKIDWLVNVFADAEGNLKPGLNMDPATVMTEIRNGVELYPDAVELKRLLEQARERFS